MIVHVNITWLVIVLTSNLWPRMTILLLLSAGIDKSIVTCSENVELYGRTAMNLYEENDLPELAAMLSDD